MNLSNSEIIEFELEKLQQINGVMGIAIANRNGLLVNSRLPRDIDGRKLCAMAATMFESIEIATSTLGSKNVNNLTVEFDDFQILAGPISDRLLIISLLDININFGLILIEIEESIKKIKEYNKGGE